MDSNIQLSEGDILLMKDGAAMGKLAFVDKLPAPACLNSHLLLFRPMITNVGEKYDPKFMFYFMLTNLFQDYVQVNGIGSTFSGVSQEAIGNCEICLPPVYEQRAIADLLDSETFGNNSLIFKLQKSIDILQEYRTALISAAVTGKIDVRQEVA
jgi:type I restriction enzyme S subunit